MINQEAPNFEEFFPVGQRVRCENECFPGRWEYGTVACHRMNNFGECQWICIKMDDDPLGSVWTEFDYRYLDMEDSRNSLVRKVQ
jgi:hypothetical protein